MLNVPGRDTSLAVGICRTTTTRRSPFYVFWRQRGAEVDYGVARSKHPPRRFETGCGIVERDAMRAGGGCTSSFELSCHLRKFPMKCPRCRSAVYRSRTNAQQSWVRRLLFTELRCSRCGLRIQRPAILALGIRAPRGVPAARPDPLWQERRDIRLDAAHPPPKNVRVAGRRRLRRRVKFDLLSIPSRPRSRSNAAWFLPSSRKPPAS